MFELKIALKYLLPKKRSLSAALISLMSVGVISLVVWLVLVFLSVTSGIEKNWLKKLTAMHAPLRISPTPAYYHSYFYQVDQLSAYSNYTKKTIGEKQESLRSDPYSPDCDSELPHTIPPPEKNSLGQIVDPVKELYSILNDLNLTYQDYEIGGALMQLHLKKGTMLSQMSFLLSTPDQNPNLASLILSKTLPQLKPKSDVMPVILPKSYKDNGAQIGDRGNFCYSAISATSMQEQKVPFQVVDFYDPGIMSVGNKCVLVPKELTRSIYGSTQTFSPDGTPTNGIFVWTDLTQVKSIEEKISQAIRQKGIDSYWKVTHYEDFEFAKDLLNQFRSDKTLLLIIAAIILIVACCNVISLLTLLVNDKKKEIAILQSMGASFKSIAFIFGSCGMIMGLLSGILGALLASFTLHHIDSLVSFLSYIQGRKAFNPAFFGQSLPDSLSYEALYFVLITTPLISFLAGLIPAIKASKIRPSHTLRAE